jgi:hypothetical protein
MALNKGEPDLDDNDVEDYIDKASVSSLRRMVRRLRAKRLSDRDSADIEQDEKDAESERNKLADLHEEKKGPAPKQEVSDEDLPFELGEEGEEEDSSSMEASCDCSAEECDDPSCAVHGKPSKGSKGR